MIRGVIFLLMAAAVVALVMSLVRRARRPPKEYQAYPTAAETEKAPPSLPAPTPEESGATLSVDEVLHKLNELAFARTLTTSAGGHDEIIATVTAALETAANEPKYAPRRPMLLPQ